MWENEPDELVLLWPDWIKSPFRISNTFIVRSRGKKQHATLTKTGSSFFIRTKPSTQNDKKNKQWTYFWCVWLRSRSRERKRQPIRTNKGTYINTDRFEIYLLFFVCLSDFKVKTYIESRIKRSDNQLLSNVYWFSFGIIPLIIPGWTWTAAPATSTSSTSTTIAFAVTGWSGFRTGTADRSKQIKQAINAKLRRGDDGVCFQNLLSVDSEILVDSHFVIPCS